LKLIVGLGNPGKRYANTRHNIGFRVIDELAKRHSVNIKKKLFGSAQEAHLNLYENRCLLIKPLSYMNLSGSCILRYIHKFKINVEDILIVCDDINLPLGGIRIRPEGSSGGHNGLESIIKILKAEAFSRLRIGIKGKQIYQDLAEYVLSDFKKDEIGRIEDAILSAADACECWLREGIDKAMNIYNK
jgi:PTH1 family peptidyl-tRNA hydrolase